MSRLQYLTAMISGGLFLLLTPLAQVALVAIAYATVSDIPELDYLFVPYSAAAVLTVLCLQVAIVCVLLLLRRIYTQRFFEATALRLIDTLTFSLTGAGIIPIIVIHHLNWAENANPPVLMLFAWCLTFFTPALFLVMRALRSVYMQAAAEHLELEQVV